MDVQDLAVQLGITLRHIPVGTTDPFQPLDLFIFGALKSMSRRRFLERIRDRPPDKVTRREAVQMLIWALMHLEKETLADAWERHCDSVVYGNAKSENPSMTLLRNTGPHVM
jgi:hypothetical protein